MLIDLQIHSTYSDGYLSPTEVAQFLAKQGVKVAALTDHNTIGGWTEFSQACRKQGIKPLPALEIYVKLGSRQLNLLWYNFDHTSPLLHSLLQGIRLRRRVQVRKFLIKFCGRGVKLDIEKILDGYNHYIPVNHIVDDIMADKAAAAFVRRKLKAKAPREEEIIHEIFYQSKTSHLRESCVALARVLALRKRLGGQLVLAHPGKNNQLEPKLLAKLKALGVDGIEVLSAHHNYGATVYAQHLAHHFKFISSGGSDFHKYEVFGQIHDAYQYSQIDSALLPGIEKIIKN